jgi:hypothetical protein
MEYLESGNDLYDIFIPLFPQKWNSGIGEKDL